MRTLAAVNVQIWQNLYLEAKIIGSEDVHSSVENFRVPELSLWGSTSTAVKIPVQSHSKTEYQNNS